MNPVWKRRDVIYRDFSIGEIRLETESGDRYRLKKDIGITLIPLSSIDHKSLFFRHLTDFNTYRKQHNIKWRCLE